MRIIIGITGASGAIYAQRFLQQCNAEKFLVVSKWGKVLLKDELGIDENAIAPFVKKQFSDDDLAAPISSGSNLFDAYIILPCSTSTLGKIASGIGDTLITRTAQVALKERRKLIICLRETPLSTITLEQCAKLSRDGVVIMPISPPMYSCNTQTDIVGAFTNKLLGVIGMNETKAWRAEELE